MKVEPVDLLLLIIIYFFMVIYYRLLIGFIEDKNNPDVWRGYVYSISMFLVALVQSLALQQYFHVVFVLGMKIRTAVIGMIYSKVWNIHVRDDA